MARAARLMPAYPWIASLLLHSHKRSVSDNALERPHLSMKTTDTGVPVHLWRTSARRNMQRLAYTRRFGPCLVPSSTRSVRQHSRISLSIILHAIYALPATDTRRSRPTSRLRIQTPATLQTPSIQSSPHAQAQGRRVPPHPPPSSSAGAGRVAQGCGGACVRAACAGGSSTHGDGRGRGCIFLTVVAGAGIIIGASATRDGRGGGDKRRWDADWDWGGRGRGGRAGAAGTDQTSARMRGVERESGVPRLMRRGASRRAPSAPSNPGCAAFDATDAYQARTQAASRISI
ncbi:hypothetical protein B0H17DRAFT_1133777 [Mycena rosella]|uniref:Uncharacterized protein n=1 Tax=Mycena rosella TaxID=1033263 RepID=A0AAD7DHM7_MYCRO|nr:hypothetical protein B0H17DRAFT_1133777 [Mycena rosella]